MRNNNFPGSCIEQRLQVLVNLCPAVLELQDDNNPLFDAAENSLIGQYACFISVLIAGIHKLTKNNGILLLFRIITFNSNPVRVLNNLQGEREEYIGREEARERKKERKKRETERKRKFAKCPDITPFSSFINRWSNKKEENQKRSDAIYNALNNPILCRHHPPYDTVQAIFEAATSEMISLDGVFFFLRREPDVLQKLLLRGNDANNDNSTTDNINHTTKRNSMAISNTSANTVLISTKKTKTK